MNNNENRRKLNIMLWEQGVPGSNPGIPTIKNKELDKKSNSLFLF